MNINGTEMLVILLLALVVLGPKELPKVGRTVGNAVREFRQASRGLADDLRIDKMWEDGEKTRPRG